MFLIRREARSKRFKCPRCNSFSAGNPVNYHEHVDHECTAPWPTEVPAASNPVKPAGRARGRQAAVAPASPAAAPAAPLLNLPPPSPPPKRSPGPSEGLSADDMSIDAEGEADLAEMGIRSAARMDPELVPQLAAGPIGSTPAHDSAFFPTLSPAGTLAAPTSSTNAQTQSSAGLSSEGLTKRGAPRRSESARSLKVKPVTLTQDELSDDEEHPEYEAVASEELDSEEEERLSRPRVGEPKRKNRASTAASDGSKVHPLPCSPSLEPAQELTLAPFARLSVSPASTSSRRASSRRGRSRAASACRRWRLQTNRSRRCTTACTTRRCARLARPSRATVRAVTDNHPLVKSANQSLT